MRISYGMMTEEEFKNWLPPPYVPQEEEDPDELSSGPELSAGTFDLTADPPRPGKKAKAKAKAKAKGKSRSTGAKGSKRCTKCGETRSVEDFRPHDSTADGLAAYCRFCQNELNRSYRDKNPVGRIKHHFATRVADQFGGKDNLPKSYTADLEQYLGYKLSSLVVALDAQLAIDYPELGWSTIDALKKGWHIDHIRPLSAFMPTKVGDEEFRRCWAITNLRVIPAEDNLAKGTSSV